MSKQIQRSNFKTVVVTDKIPGVDLPGKNGKYIVQTKSTLNAIHQKIDNYHWLEANYHIDDKGKGHFSVNNQVIVAWLDDTAQEKKISFVSDDKKITIEIPIDLLIHITENIPDIPVKVLKRKEFLEKMLFALEHSCGDNESGLTGFQLLIDECVIDLIEGGEECLEVIESLED